MSPTDSDRDFFDGSRYDPETVRFFDVAHEGAQIRAVAEAVDKLSHLRGFDPRSVVILSPEHLARHAARLAVTHLEPLRTPLVVTDRLPTFVGALDAVIALTDRGEHPQLAQDLIAAGNRGAEVVVAGPARGPLLEDLPERAAVIPALPTVAGFSPARAITTVIAVLDACNGAEVPVAERLGQLADNVDAEIAALSPERDETINPGRGLRIFADGARIVHTGPGEFTEDHVVGARTAELVAHLWSARGLPSGFVDPGEIADLVATQSTANSNDIFHDPFLDEEPVLLPLKVIVWAAEEAGWPNSLAVNVDPATRSLGRLDTTLRLITKALAATTYQDPGAARV